MYHNHDTTSATSTQLDTGQEQTQRPTVQASLLETTSMRPPSDEGHWIVEKTGPGPEPEPEPDPETKSYRQTGLPSRDVASKGGHVDTTAQTSSLVCETLRLPADSTDRHDRYDRYDRHLQHFLDEITR
ncbi:MAG: hypothetical protein J07HQX50_01683 [Haloquadratum sp. J07HQX50]|nr:MAG: hypothetical protein J07HQX50_01683 [Haloquadratum sp. J07HQX50]